MNYSGTDIALLLVRVGIAVVFMSHGFNNIQEFLYFIGFVELIAGILMLLGIGASWAGIILAADMIGSVTFMKVSNGFVGFELELVLFLSTIAIAFSGAGKYTIRRLWKKS